ncbi:MAG: hypothetical protein ACRD8U_08660, partial [Pyrinomonadaceae bacterium]
MRNMFMLASRTDSISRRYFSREMRVGKLTAGIQLPPLANTGTPLMTNSKLCPHLSVCCFNCTERNP